MKSRRQGTSQATLRYYEGYLTRSARVIGPTTTGRDIDSFLASLKCSGAGRHAYYRALRAYHNWLFSRRSGCGLDPGDNPILAVDPPKIERRLLPSLTEQQVDILIEAATHLRDKAIISLLADSGLRLSELAGLKAGDIDWVTHTVTIIGKGNKQRKAPFTARSAQFLRAYLASNPIGWGSIWGIDRFAVNRMLGRLGKATGIKCNPHAFRRGFACNLHRRGLSTLDIMHLGGWETLSMVLRYTQSVTVDDCLKHYQAAFNQGVRQ